MGDSHVKSKEDKTFSYMESGSISWHSFFPQLTSKKHKVIRFSLGQGGPTHGSLCVCWKLQLPAGVVLQPRDLVRSPPGPQVPEHWPHADHGVKLLPATKMDINCSNRFSMVRYTIAIKARYLKVFLSAFAAFESHALSVLCFLFEFTLRASFTWTPNTSTSLLGLSWTLFASMRWSWVCTRSSSCFLTFSTTVGTWTPRRPVAPSTVHF